MQEQRVPAGVASAPLQVGVTPDPLPVVLTGTSVVVFSGTALDIQGTVMTQIASLPVPVTAMGTTTVLVSTNPLPVALPPGTLLVQVATNPLPVAQAGTATVYVANNPLPVTQSGTVMVRQTTDQEPGDYSFNLPVAAAVGTTVEIALNDAVSIGFHLHTPPNGRVLFEGSWDRIDWQDVTLRQMGGHGYSTTTAEDEGWIGSVATFKFFRLRVIVEGSSPGSVHGKLSKSFCMLEGIEHGYMPHKIGATITAKSFSFSGVASNRTIWLPADPTHKLVVSDLHFTVLNNNVSVITFSDGSLADNLLLFRGQIKPPQNESVYVPISFSLPHVFSGTARPLYFSQTGACEVDGVVHGYEAEP